VDDNFFDFGGHSLQVVQVQNRLRETIGVDRKMFEQIADVGEAGDGELPFRVETREIDGETKEVCRVYDMAAKSWRDASPDEIQRAA